MNKAVNKAVNKAWREPEGCGDRESAAHRARGRRIRLGAGRAAPPRGAGARDVRLGRALEPYRRGRTMMPLRPAVRPPEASRPLAAVVQDERRRRQPQAYAGIVPLLCVDVSANVDEGSGLRGHGGCQRPPKKDILPRQRAGVLEMAERHTHGGRDAVGRGHRRLNLLLDAVVQQLSCQAHGDEEAGALGEVEWPSGLRVLQQRISQHAVALIAVLVIEPIRTPCEYVPVVRLLHSPQHGRALGDILDPAHPSKLIKTAPQVRGDARQQKHHIIVGLTQKLGVRPPSHRAMHPCP